jgi:hypothetical protein
MGWFCDTYSRLKAENEELKDKLIGLEVLLDASRKVAADQRESFDTYNKNRDIELDTLRLQVQLYDQIMKGLRINVNLDGKKK